MLLANEIVLVHETRSGINAKLEILCDTLKSEGLQLNRAKTEFMESKTRWPIDAKE